MKITLKWLKENNACPEGSKWFLNQNETEIEPVIKALIKEGKFDWANWTITHLMSHKQNVQYACFSAKQALHCFEKVYPQDKRPHKAIKAALKWGHNPSEVNRSAAESAELAAWSAARLAARSAESAARSAARSAESAARLAELAAWSAARSAESAARSAELAAWSAARSAARSAESAARSAAAWKKILSYGLKLVANRGTL